MKRLVMQMKNSGPAVKTCKTCRRLRENGSCSLSYAYIKDCIEHGLAHWRDKDGEYDGQIINRGGRPMTKDELERYKYISDEIAQLWDEINRLRDGLMSPSGKVITWTPASPRQDDKFAEVMAQIDEFERELIEKLEERIEIQRSIEQAIESVDDPLLRRILRSRYIQGESIKQIASDTGYTRRQVQNLHNEALEKVKDFRPFPTH